jgi:hypothetical protein
MLKIVQQKLVGVAGFEPTTSASRTRRATKLRYTPKILQVIQLYPYAGNLYNLEIIIHVSQLGVTAILK